MLAALSRDNSRIAIEKEHFFTFSAPQRLSCFLIRLCTMQSLPSDRFTLPYSKSVIASTLGMEPESLSRAFTKLRKIGVSVNGDEVSIANKEALVDYVCAACSVSEDCETCGAVRSSCAHRLQA